MNNDHNGNFLKNGARFSQPFFRGQIRKQFCQQWFKSMAANNNLLLDVCVVS